MNTDLFSREPARDHKARILIVEDNAVIRDLLRGIMRHDAELSVVGEATNGETAIDLAEKLHPDLVCLDVLLPGLDGIAILRALRAVHRKCALCSSRARPRAASYRKRSRSAPRGSW